jgi:hypothetical protein
MNRYSCKELESFTARLLAAGIPVPDRDRTDEESDLTIEVRNPAQTKGFDSDPDAEFVFDVKITNRCYSLLEIQQIKCSLPWENALFTWIRDSLWGWPQRRVYRLPSGREFSPETVLNHRCGKLGALEPGESLEGVLLALSMDCRIPADYSHGLSFPVQLSAVDQYGRHHASIIEVEVDRSLAIKISRPTRAREGLFERDSICSGEAKHPQRQMSVSRDWGSTDSVPDIRKELEN